MKYIIIPDEVFSSDLSQGCQLLYGLLYSIWRTKKRPVQSDNKWLGMRLQKDERVIQRRLHILREKGYITIYYKRVHKTQVNRVIVPILRGDISVGEKEEKE